MMRLAGTSLVFYRHSGNFVYVILSVATLAPHCVLCSAGENLQYGERDPSVAEQRSIRVT